MRRMQNTSNDPQVSPEYLSHRCCMCPNIGKADKTCPGIPGTGHPDPDPCRFVKSYIDQRGWKYKVMGGISQDSFKARYQKSEKNGSTGWKGVAAVPWQKTFDAAQADLNALAAAKGWSEWKPD